MRAVLFDPHSGCYEVRVVPRDSLYSLVEWPDLAKLEICR